MASERAATSSKEGLDGRCGGVEYSGQVRCADVEDSCRVGAHVRVEDVETAASERAAHVLLLEAATVMVMSLLQVQVKALLLV